MDFPVEIDIPGRFSVNNSLTAIAICHQFGVSPEIIQEALAKVKVKGRVELVPVSDRYTLMIDYAHNAMALESLLTTLREYHPKRLVCMFGCGGNRDAAKRPKMAAAAAKYADMLIVTSDNPRNEDPELIIKDILTGLAGTDIPYDVVTDRREAIYHGLQIAQKGDIIVLAGKGHEDYQILAGMKHIHFDEREVVADGLRLLAGE